MADTVIQQSESRKILVNIIMHTSTKIEIEIPCWFRGIDLIMLIAEKIKLRSYCDFGLYETDE